MIADKPIDTVLFDFDGTLVFHEPDSSDILSSFCSEMGQPLNAEREWKLRRTRHEYFVDPLIRSELASFGPGDFWTHFNRHLLAAVGIEGDLDSIAAEVTSRTVGLDFRYDCPVDGTHTLEELRRRGYALGLITNRSNVTRFDELLDELELRSYFDLVLASGEVGVHKPEPGIFYAALERMDAKPQRSIYVGDNYWADVVGAERAGVAPVLYDPRRLFPEAECLVLDRIGELLDQLPAAAPSRD